MCEHLLLLFFPPRSDSRRASRVWWNVQLDGSRDRPQPLRHEITTMLRSHNRVLTSLSPSEKKLCQRPSAPASTSAYRTYLSKPSPFPSTVSAAPCVHIPHDTLIGCADKHPQISVDSHVQVLLARVCLVLCILLPPRDIFPPPGRSHPPHICRCAFNGSDGDPFRPCGFHSRPLGQRARGAAMVPHSNAHSRQALGDEPSSCNYLLVGTYHGSHHGHRQRPSRELE